MKIDVIPWVTHSDRGGSAAGPSRKPLFSCDISHDGNRLATAGADFSIRIWNFQAILSGQQEADPRVPLVLATLTRDTPSNVVRFSPPQYTNAEGKKSLLLAWGDSKSNINVAELAAGPASKSFDATHTSAVENWRTVRAFQGHRNDVVDLAWSPPIDRGGKEVIYLVSASMDSTLKVWDVQGNALVTTLVGHQSFVKGCAFDPAGRFLASQGDDAKVIVWSTDNWAPTHVIQAPFVEGGGASTYVSTMFTRLNWIADGQALIVPNCHDAGKNPFAQSVARNSWHETNTQRFVGHQLPTTVVKCSPHLYRPSRELMQALGRKVPTEPTTVVAIGSNDHTLSIWIGASPRPIIVTQRLFEAAVTDLAWAPDGFSLVAASYDGSLACIQFDRAELGQPLSPPEVAATLERIYGKQSRLGLLPTSADQLEMEDAAERARKAAARANPGPTALERRLGAGPGTTQSTAAAAAGAPRALPAALAAVMNRVGASAAGAGPSAAAGQQQPRAKDAQPTPQEKEKDKPAAGPAEKRPTAPGEAPSPLKKPRAQPNVGAAGAAPAAVAVAPAAPTAAPAAPPPPPAPKKLQLPLVMRPQINLQLGRRPPTQNLAQPSTSQGPVVVLEVRNDARALATRGQGEASTAQALPARQPAACSLRCSLLPPFGPAPAAPPGAAVAPVAPTPEVLWEEELPAVATAAAGCLQFSAVGTDDGSLHVYSPMGRRLLPRLVLGSPPVFLECSARPSGCHLLCATRDGSLHHWDLAAMRKVLSCSLEPLMKDLEPKNDTVAAVRLSSAGLPLAYTATRKCYAYYAAMEVWTAVADDSYPASAYHNTLPGLTGGAGHELSQLVAEAAQRQQGALLMAAANAGRSRQVADSRGHVESLVAASAALSSKADLERYLELYGKVLSNADDAWATSRIRELASDLLGGLLHNARDQGTIGEPVGAVRTACTRLELDPCKLLEERLLPALVTNRALQSLLSEIREDIKVARLRQEEGSQDNDPFAML